MIRDKQHIPYLFPWVRQQTGKGQDGSVPSDEAGKKCWRVMRITEGKLEMGRGDSVT